MKKKIYSTPKTDVCVVETSILCASIGGEVGYIPKEEGTW